jgi:hypothetical protein
MRFHVDSWKYRTWGRDDHGHLACPKVDVPPPVLATAPVGGVSPAEAATAAAVVSATPAPKSPQSVSSLPARDPLAPL